MLSNYTGFLGTSYFSGALGALMIFAIVVWSLAWKGFALWRAAREKSPWWFTIILIVNTLGILEILYLFFFSDAARIARGAAKKEEKPAHDASGGTHQDGDHR
jgi:hypothetical protein